MPTVLDILGTSTPVSEALAEKLGYVKAAIACRIFFYQQLKNGVCSATIGTLSKKLGMSAGTISTNIQWLRDNEYIDVVGEHKKGNTPNKYIVTQQFYDSLEHSSNESEHSADESNIQQMNGEEEVKEESESSLYKENPPKPKYKKRKQPKPKTLEGYGPVARSVLETTQLDPAAIINGTELNFDNVLEFLAIKEATPQQVAAFGQWYEKTPNLNAITENWKLFVDGKQPRHKQFKNGNGANRNGNQQNTNGTGIKLTPEQQARADEISRQIEAAAATKPN